MARSRLTCRVHGAGRPWDLHSPRSEEVRRFPSFACYHSLRRETPYLNTAGLRVDDSFGRLGCSGQKGCGPHIPPSNHSQIRLPELIGPAGAPSTAGLRVALFTDSFHEINGVGTLCREYAAYARDRGFPFFCAYGGQETKWHKSGSVEELELRRGPLSFEVDAGIKCDPFLTRFRAMTVSRLREFRPDLVHITGPGDVSTLGFWASHLLGVPMVASWHTNLHQYANLRAQSSLGFLPDRLRTWIGAGAGNGTLWAVTRFYGIAHFAIAPNQDTTDFLAGRTHRPVFCMRHGVNTDLFAPSRRTSADTRFTIGYVGRMTPEKNVRALADMEQQLLDSGERDFRIVMVGDGSEADWLRDHLRAAEFTGLLRDNALATAFANMDAFVFPSYTDTLGLVILEALSSGVPVILPPEAGRRAGLTDGIDGFLTDEFASGVRRLMHSSETRCRMGVACREHSLSMSWSSVFDDLRRIYQDGLDTEHVRRRMPTPKFGLHSTPGLI